MKILCVSHSSGVAGAEKVFARSIQALSSMNDIFLVKPIGIGNFDSLLSKDINIRGSFTLSYRLMGNSTFRIIIKLLLSIPSVFKLTYIIKRNQIEIVYVNTIVNWAGVIAAKICKRKCIVHCHEHPNSFEEYSSTKLDFLLSFIIRHSSAKIIYISEEMKEIWRKRLSYYNDCVVYNPISITSYSSSDAIKKSDIQVIGFAGTLYKRKNVETLIFATSKLLEVFPNVKLIIAGDGPQRDQLEELTKKLGISECVNFVGQVKEMESFYNSIDIIVLPSYAEAMPLVVVEALSYSIPCIVTRNTALSEVICFDNAVFVFSPENINELTLLLENTLPNCRKLSKHLTKNQKNIFKNIGADFDKELLEAIDE